MRTLSPPTGLKSCGIRMLSGMLNLKHPTKGFGFINRKGGEGQVLGLSGGGKKWSLSLNDLTKKTRSMRSLMRDGHVTLETRKKGEHKPSCRQQLG